MSDMRTIGIILIIAGILMMVFTGFNFTTEKRVVDLGPLKVDKQENHSIGWPMYVGGVVLLGGIGLVVAGAKRR